MVDLGDKTGLISAVDVLERVKYVSFEALFGWATW